MFRRVNVTNLFMLCYRYYSALIIEYVHD